METTLSNRQYQGRTDSYQAGVHDFYETFGIRKEDVELISPRAEEAGRRPYYSIPNYILESYMTDSRTISSSALDEDEDEDDDDDLDVDELDLEEEDDEAVAEEDIEIDAEDADLDITEDDEDDDDDL